jgi:hypothetical protein
MKTSENKKVDTVKDLDVIIKSFKRRMKKHPEENYSGLIHKYSDEQFKELKRSIKDMEDFIEMNNEGDFGEEEI